MHSAYWNYVHYANKFGKSAEGEGRWAAESIAAFRRCEVIDTIPATHHHPCHTPPHTHHHYCHTTILLPHTTILLPQLTAGASIYRQCLKLRTPSPALFTPSPALFTGEFQH